MDTVSDDTMAIALGKLGGVAFIHRNQTTEDEVAMVSRAKQAGVRVGAACGTRHHCRARVCYHCGL